MSTYHDESVPVNAVTGQSSLFTQEFFHPHNFEVLANMGMKKMN